MKSCFRDRNILKLLFVIGNVFPRPQLSINVLFNCALSRKKSKRCSKHPIQDDRITALKQESTIPNRKMNFTHPSGRCINSDWLPPAYVVRREGNSFTLFVCPHRGGVRVPPQGGTRVRYPPPGGWGGYPGVVPPWGGYPVPVPPRGGGTWVRYPPMGGTRFRYPPPPGGTQVRYPPGGEGGVPGSGTPPGGVPRSGTPPPRGGGYPGRTTEGVLTTRRAVCLLRSRRRTFWFVNNFIMVVCEKFVFSSVRILCPKDA